MKQCIKFVHTDMRYELLLFYGVKYPYRQKRTCSSLTDLHLGEATAKIDKFFSSLHMNSNPKAMFTHSVFRTVFVGSTCLTHF